MGKEILMFNNIEIEKNKFYRHKAPIFLKDVDTEKTLVSNKISSGEKNYNYFTAYWYNDNKVKSLHIKPFNITLPKTSTYVKGDDEQTK